MPGLSCWIIRVSLGYLIIGFGLGAVLLTGKALPPGAVLAALRPMHVEFLTIGWMMQLVLGVAYWILPRYAHGDARGATALVVLAFVLLNIGVWLTGLGAALAIPAVPLAGRAAEFTAMALFATHAWSRVKPFGAGRL